MTTQARATRTVWDMTGYQWTVLFAAWLGWGFDCFDGLLFNFVAPNCVPTLLGLQIGSPEANAATLAWTGRLAAVLLLGWAAGGILFGKVADKLGRTRTLLITMTLYAVGTSLCAIAPNLWVLTLFRIIASLGIGGEWAAGAAMVAEVVPEKRRVEAGALLYTSAPVGLYLATLANYQIARVHFANTPETSWRYVFLCGLIPAAVAFAVRVFVKEPERWKSVASSAEEPKVSELFGPRYRRITLSGFLMALTALMMWWTSNSFIQAVSSGLARQSAKAGGLDTAATLALVEDWKALATHCFNVGGFLGTLLTVPVAKWFGRKPMFALYFILSAASLMCAFGLPLPPVMRLYMYFPIGLTVFGVFGSFTYYLPELFPTRMRGTGAGFCYNVGRVIAAAGPFLLGWVASRGADSLATAMRLLFYVGFVPVFGLLVMPWVIETHGKPLED